MNCGKRVLYLHYVESAKCTDIRMVRLCAMAYHCGGIQGAGNGAGGQEVSAPLE